MNGMSAAMAINAAFREKFREIFGTPCDIIATIDHPFASPPIRIIDGHSRLMQFAREGMRPLLCIWDVMRPESANSRYGLGFDTGIFSGKKNREFFIFSDAMLYPLQRPRMIDFIEVRERVLMILERLHDLPSHRRKRRDERFIKQFEQISALYSEVISHSGNGTEFYRNLLVAFYRQIGFDELSLFCSSSSLSYYWGPVIPQWIPYCIETTKEEPFGMLALLRQGVFMRPCFRYAANHRPAADFANAAYISQHVHSIMENLANRSLIPSFEVFFWTLSLAGIRHFGNDYGFFRRLDRAVSPLGLHAAELQLTMPDRHSRNIIRFDRDRSFNCYRTNGGYDIRKNNPSKTFKLSTIPSLYSHLGQELGTIVRAVLAGEVPSPVIIPMGHTGYQTATEAAYVPSQ